MKTLAAVLVETGHPLELVELEIPPLRPGQVLVEVVYSGVCHTQILEARGFRGEDRYLPHCLGHEGSGVVLETGAEVTKCGAGDRVILSWMRGSGANVPGSVYRWDGRGVNAGGITTFQKYAVVSEDRIVALPADVGNRQGALMGCAVPTGFGAVWNSGRAESGQSVAVFGLGGIGASAVAAASTLAAKPLFAIDINAARLRLATQFGATELIDATREDPIGRIRQTCADGIDLAIEATGRPEVMRTALAAVHPRGGTVVIIGNARHGESLEIDPAELNQGKRLIGSWGGDNDPDRDFPKYCQLVSDGRLDLSPLFPKTYRLEDINQALDDLEQGTVPRPLIGMHENGQND